MTAEPQSLQAKHAETARDFLGESILINREFAMEMFARGGKAAVDVRRLGHQGVLTSPFLEIGAGNTPRSLALANQFALEGVATDISLNSLHNSPYLRQALGFDKTPWRICCDAHHLPFMDGSFPFIFTYRTLHHFSDPVPVLGEVHRVLLPGGNFYFNEEPFDGPLRRWLRGNRVLKHPPTRMQDIGARLGVSRIFWDDVEYERSVGITEARYELGVWRAVLAPFKHTSVSVNRRLQLKSDLYTPAWKVWISNLAGGNIEGMCQKDGILGETPDIYQRLQCLDCRFAPLIPVTGESLTCPSCQRTYPCVDGVLRMLPKALEEQLYPA